MPRVHAFDMRQPGEWERWHAWRQMVAWRETWRSELWRIEHARWVYHTHLRSSLVKQAWHTVDKRLFTDKAVKWPNSLLAIYWADDSYWAILPTLTKGD